MPTRFRTQNVKVSSGRMRRKLDDSILVVTRTESFDECTDTIPAKRDQYFQAWHLDSEGGFISGESNGIEILSPIPIPNTGRGSSNFIEHTYSSDPNSNSYWATKVAGETNPSEPLVPVGETLAELREVPSQLKKVGLDLFNSFNYKKGRGRRNAFLLSGALADLNLRFQFGIKPIVSDIFSLVSIRRSLNNKIRDILSIEKNGGLIRKRVVFTGVKTGAWSESRVTFSQWGAGNFIYIKARSSTYSKKWVVCRWVPDGTRKLPLHRDKGFQRRFGVSMLGMDIFNFRNIWNALPWSWLTDWAFNVGDYASATNNTLGYKLASVVVCTEHITEQEIKVTSLPAGLKATELKRKLITRTRQPVTLSVEPRLPLLSGKQTGILASIIRSRLRN